MVSILLRFSEEQVSQPIACQIIIEYKVPMAILSAHINAKGGEILAEIPDEHAGKSRRSFPRKRRLSYCTKTHRSRQRKMLQLRFLCCALSCGSNKQ